MRVHRARLQRRTRQFLARCQACRGDAGASALELVMLTPLVFLMTFIPIQAGLVIHARQVATSAAQEGARAARVADLSAGQAQAAGVQRATDFAGLLGGNTLQATSVSVTRGADQVTVTVNGTALAILPGMKLAVTGSSVSPVERFSAP